MPTHSVRVYCEECKEYKTAEQETVDNRLVPPGCEDHTLRDFVIEAIDDPQR